MPDDGDQLDLYCHGSLKNQEKTTVKLGRKNTGLSSFSLECKGGKFVSVEDKVTCSLVMFTALQFSHFKASVEVETTTCSRKQEPRLVREQEECSAVGADGRSDDLSQLVRVSIGWQIGDTFIEQIGICHDEKVYGTIWSNYTLHGASIDFRYKICTIKL